MQKWHIVALAVWRLALVAAIGLLAAHLPGDVRPCADLLRDLLGSRLSASSCRPLPLPASLP